ncbi:type IV pilus biogenesis protein PilM [Pantoea sp. XAF26B01_ASV70]
MGFALPIIALAMFFGLMASDAQRRNSDVVTQSVFVAVPARLATDMLRTADAVNDWRHGRSVGDGPVSPSQFGMMPAPDRKIKSVIQSGRLWVWIADTPGVYAALRRQSASSALVLTVSGGRLRMYDGTDMNLPLPSGVTEGSIVYLN